MNNKMNDEEINKIAQAIAAKIAEPGGPALLGCGDASSSQSYSCSSGSYQCGGSYECGGAGQFRCALSFRCIMDFDCRSNFQCSSYFDCATHYNA